MANQNERNQEAKNIIYNLSYNEVYRHVVDIAKDVKRFDTTKNEDVEKCKWIAAMVDVFFDVPMHNAVNTLHLNNIQFDSKNFLSERKDEAMARRYKKHTICDYEFAYDLIVDIAFDADAFFVSENASAEQIEKCKWISVMCDVLSDIYMDVVDPAFVNLGFHFDWEAFAMEHNLG